MAKFTRILLWLITNVRVKLKVSPTIYWIG